MAEKPRKLICAGVVLADPDSEPIREGAILIEGKRIAAVDRKDQLVSLVGREEIIDCGDRCLMPGMIDSHNHLSLDCSIDNYLQRMNDSESELTLRAVNTIKVDLQAGVTTSRCMGDKHFLDVRVREAVAKGRIKGPRLLVSTRGLRAGHGHGFVGYICDGSEQLRTMVRENIKGGADLIKFYATGTVLQNSSIPCFYSPKEIETIIDEAHRVGLRTAVHCIGGNGLKVCLEAGVDTIEHGYYLSDEEIELILTSSAQLVLTPGEFLTDKETLPPAHLALFKRGRSFVQSRMAAIVASGLPYAVGTDGSHGGLAEEAIHLVNLGAKKVDVLRALTMNGAQVCGLESVTGNLVDGKFADIIAVSDNPLRDITALKNVTMVMKEGEIIFRSS